jgi:cytoskeletal protein RodZ
LPTVGEILRAEREKQGKTVKDIERGTSIRALYIQAIEDGRYEVLPGEVYLKGFIRNYASYLGLNAQQVLAVYRESQSPQPAQEPAAAKPAATRSSASDKQPNGGRKSSVWRWLIAMVVIAIAAGAAWAAMNYLNPPAPTKPAPTPQAQVQPAPPPAAPAKPPAQAPTPAPAPAPATRPIVVQAKYTAECWTLVTADGREVYEGIPRPGETLTWNADRAMTLQIGNAAGIELTYNGQPQGRLGGDGEVVSKTFTASTAGSTRR